MAISTQERKVDKDSEAGLSAGERANLSGSGNDLVSNVSILHDLLRLGGSAESSYRGFIRVVASTVAS